MYKIISILISFLIVISCRQETTEESIEKYEIKIYSGGLLILTDTLDNFDSYSSDGSITCYKNKEKYYIENSDCIVREIKVKK